MSKQSIRLLESTLGQVNVTGPAVKAAGYYGSTRGLHTLAVYLSDFTGRLYIQGTLATDPQEDDWFNIELQNNSAYTEFPIVNGSPTGINGDTGVDSFSFEANLVWLRAVVDRSYLPTPEDPIHGSISKILVNY